MLALQGLVFRRDGIPLANSKRGFPDHRLTHLLHFTVEWAYSSSCAGCSKDSELSNVQAGSAVPAKFNKRRDASAEGAMTLKPASN